MSLQFTQTTFFFATEQRKSSTLLPSSSSKFISPTLQVGLDETTLKNNSVLLLRGVLAQNMRRGLNPDSLSQTARSKFMHTLSQEIKLKKSKADPVYLLRDCLIQL